MTCLQTAAVQAALDGRTAKKGRPLLAYAVALAAALSVEGPFMHVDNIAVIACWLATYFSPLLMLAYSCTQHCDWQFGQLHSKL